MAACCRGTVPHLVLQRHTLGVRLQDFLAAAHVRKAHRDVCVEAAGAHQRRIQQVGEVGRADDNHVVCAAAAVVGNREIPRKGEGGRG